MSNKRIPVNKNYNLKKVRTKLKLQNKEIAYLAKCHLSTVDRHIRYNRISPAFEALYRDRLVTK